MLIAVVMTAINIRIILQAQCPASRATKELTVELIRPEFS